MKRTKLIGQLDKIVEFSNNLKNGIVSRVSGLFPNTRKSNPISKMARPVLEKPALKKVLGSQLAALSLLAGVARVPVSALGVVSTDAVAFEQSYNVELKTKKAINVPVPEAYGISQGYHVLHRGVDIRGPLGSVVRSIAAGVVSSVEYGRYGYGNNVVVDHQNGYSSLYAHLGVITVEPGQSVDVEQQVGTVGLTGWTTGPHLHLEIYEEGRTVNPIDIL